MYLDNSVIARTRKLLRDIHSEDAELRIERGVDQTAALWTEADGGPVDFEIFCTTHFVSDEKQLEEMFDRFDKTFESLDGHFNAMEQTLREAMDLDIGELTPADRLLVQFDPSAHLSDDLFGQKIAFIVLLNFPRYSLEEKKVLSETWGRREWATARMGDRFQSRVPAAARQELSTAQTAAETYIAEYNIYMNIIRDIGSEQLFPDGLKLISHWGLRDELKAWYSRPGGLRRQKAIFHVMENIITQEIPAEVIDNPDIPWNPYENHVIRGGKTEIAVAEADCRYRHILDIFHAMRKVDNHYPDYPSHIRRTFDLEREMSEAEVEELFLSVLKSPQFSNTVQLIRRRLDRDLEPFDIWYAGFMPRSGLSEEKLDGIVAERYPTIEALQAGLDDILVKLGFAPARAEFIASRIVIDRARGSGHAWGPMMRSDMARLRMRAGEAGLNYKNFNIAIHELGHNVEQTISLHQTGYHMIQGVPANAFTEAFAFVFQDRDLELLGLGAEIPESKHERNLYYFWSTCEIMAVALVELYIWRWLYDHPDASAADLKKVTLEICKATWNDYFADAFGRRDEIILGIYSHMVNHTLYLADYPIGHVIQFQIEKYLEGKNIGEEMERMCAAGNILPQEWMKNAVNAEISATPLLDAAAEALETLM